MSSVFSDLELPRVEGFLGFALALDDSSLSLASLVDVGESRRHTRDVIVIVLFSVSAVSVFVYVDVGGESEELSSRGFSALQTGSVFQDLEKKDKKLIITALKAMTRKSFQQGPPPSLHSIPLFRLLRLVQRL